MTVSKLLMLTCAFSSCNSKLQGHVSDAVFNTYFSSSVATKLLIGITGFALFLYLLIHIAGNLLVFFGPDVFNRYAFVMEHGNPLLPVIEIALLLVFLLHVYKTVTMFLANQRARPVGYVKKKFAGSPSRKTIASSTMIFSGLWLLMFVIIHVKAFRYSPEYPWPGGGRDLYRQEMENFSNPLMVGFYVLSMLVVGSHSVARHLEQRAVARIDPPDVDASSARGRQGHRGAARRILHRDRALGARLGRPAMSEITLDAQIPAGPIAEKWDRHKFEMKLVNPANKRKYTIIVVGTGLSGASAAASLGELGYNVLNLCIQDSPRRAHSIAAQGGINAAKNYQNDGDSVYRLFYDTVKGGDYRSREANVYRLAQLSVNIIDQCVAQGVPFAREYGGLLDNRSFGGAQVSRTFYARGQTGQQLLLGAYQSLMRQVHAARYAVRPPRNARPRPCRRQGARHHRRNLTTGEIERYAADAVVLATGGYGTAYYLSTNA